MRCNSSLFLLALATFIVTIRSQSTTATLDYGSFKGVYNVQYNITLFGRIPFAAPPVGENRFRAPQPPLNITTGIYNSNQSFDPCPASRPLLTGSEDCLYLSLFSRPWNSSQSLRPVVIFYFGGGFIRGGGSQSLPPSGYPILNVSSQNNLLMIYPNYRTNAFGFLPGAEIAADASSDLNPGFLDQKAVLQWVKKYAKAFGGDPDDVTIFGQSAGAGSVVAQVLNTAGEKSGSEKLFRRALASSPYWPKSYKFDAPEAQGVYDKLANATGCAGNDSLNCLKNASVEAIANAAASIASSGSYGPSSYTWAPVIDGKFLRMPLSEAVKTGAIKLENGWGMYNSHEGESFTPTFNTTYTLTTWLKNYLPSLSSSNMQRLLTLYPTNGSTETISDYNTTAVRAGLIYRDSVLACPAYWMARAASNTSYVGEYTISPAKHASDVDWWNSVTAEQSSNRLIYEGFTGAFASFFSTGDPNANKLTAASIKGVPEEKSTGKEFVIAANGFDQVKIKGLDKRCGFWLDVADELPN